MRRFDETDMLSAFTEWLKVNCHCSFEHRFLLAVSGGVDSTVMAWLFREAGLEFAFAHCNFQLRGLASDQDQQFVEDMARKMEVECYVKHFQTRERAESEGHSLQMAARSLRYEWFESLRQQHGFDGVAIGHNRDDVVETVMINLARSTGIRGLTGISPRQGHIIRPLLFASRETIIDFAGRNGIQWRDDASNADIKYRRNAIRHDVIPRLEKVYPAFRQNVIRTAAHLSQASELFDLALNQIRIAVCIELPDRLLIDTEKLMEYPAVDTVLFELLKDFGCNASMARTLSGLASGKAGRRILTASHTITRDRQYLIVTKHASVDQNEYIIEKGTLSLEEPLKLRFTEIHTEVEQFAIPESRLTAALDLGQLQFPLKLRRWEHGDFFRPLGLRGRKKISDFLIDQKIPLPDKTHIWVMESGSRIAWVVGHRIDDRFRVENRTRYVLLVELTEEVAHGNL